MSSLLTRAEAAKYLGISVRTLDRRVAAGRIRFISACRGGRIQFRQDHLDKYIKDNTH